MKFLLLIYEDDAERVARMDERMPQCWAYVQARTHGVDGPHAEAEEQRGGFAVIDVPDLDAALA